MGKEMKAHNWLKVRVLRTLGFTTWQSVSVRKQEIHTTKEDAGEMCDSLRLMLLRLKLGLGSRGWCGGVLQNRMRAGAFVRSFARSLAISGLGRSK